MEMEALHEQIIFRWKIVETTDGSGSCRGGPPADRPSRRRFVMPKFNHRRIVIGLVAVIALLLSITVGLAKGSQKQEYEMRNDFATEMGASGSGKLSVHKDSIRVEVKAEGLDPKHQYELKLTIGPCPPVAMGAGDCDPPFLSGASVVTCGPKTSSRSGKLRIKCTIDLLDFLAPATYRVDIFLTHIFPTVDGLAGTGADLTGVLDRDPLLRCAPATIVMVPE